MLLYALTIFLSAFLLFQVQPMIAKMILPWFGGTAAVWATCLLFFQTTLLLGYLYSHFVVRRLKPRRQLILHAVLLAGALALLPVAPNEAWKPVGAEAPTLRILGLLALTVGLPYFLASTTGPLVQAWYAQAHPGKTPYRLYALSNAGSMLALLSYPPLVEPYLTLKQQAWVWSAGFAAFAALCLVTGWRSCRGTVQPEENGEVEAPPAGPGGRDFALWAMLAMCPSTLLLALTSHMSMDLAPIPFLWVLPLALYLLSFILCFDSEGWYRRVWLLPALPLALGTIGWLAHLGPETRPDVRISIPVYGLAFFIVCMVCHGELARLKPHPKFLTGYFLMLSVGGALGGVFVALVAPYVFNAYFEMPIALAMCLAAGLVVVYREREWPFRSSVLGWPSIGVMTLAALLLGLVGREMKDIVEGSMVVARNFYGELRVRQYNGLYEWDGYRSLVHGAINHGEQFTHPARRREIATYYCADTGLGRVMKARPVGDLQRVGIVGLGTGTIAAYSQPGDLYRFYEINPLVEKIARNDFWYLENAAGVVEVVMGDARLSMEREPKQNYDLIAVDAFSSDSIPVHLLTREAMGVYFRHLKPQGVLAVHISNRFIDLQPVLERAAKALGKQVLVVETEETDGKCFGTTWVLLSANRELLNRASLEKGAKAPEDAPWLRVWTDDYSNVFRVLR
ncbi:MAG: fused MFS/spermidine synthase [Candidatus Solibacter usitatus]|nr:fused MFS/spermidine synthase [Candidatus Solibacter usitatus]